MNEIDRLQMELFRWSSEEFGDANERGPEGPLAHLRKEIDEVMAAPGDVEEWADCFMLLMDGLSRQGIAVHAVIHQMWDKLDKNRKREWGPVNAEGFSEHVR